MLLVEKIRNFFINQKTITKSLIAFLFDLLIYISIYLFFSSYLLSNAIENIYYYLFVTFNIIILLFTGHYRNKIEFINFNSIISLASKSFILFLIINILFLFLNRNFSFFLFVSLLNIILIIYSSRILIRSMLYNDSVSNKEKILIYGAGSAGAQLLNSINLSNRYNVVGFIDDSIEKINTKISNVHVYRVDEYPSLVKKFSIDMIFIAIPSLDFNSRKQILKNLLDKNTNIRIKILPGLDSLIKKNINFNLMEDISIEDIIGRKIISPIKELLDKNINKKTVLVTGAAGTIGSELCKKILNHNPKKLIMIDSSEIGLFNLVDELKSYDCNKSFLLGDLKDKIFIKNSLLDNPDIDITYHVAAYKHVNILEENQFSGFYNNVIIIKNIIEELLISTKIKKFVNVSTDKAVQPSTIMGLSKYFCELIGNEFSKKSNIEFSIVRFGNVLKSSGSVLTVFDKQIKNKGPVTVTDKRVKRFFMSVEEAVSLIIQSSALSGKNRRFVLDMGDQLSVYNIAKKMILLNGFSIKDNNNPNGDIEIKIIGLKKGEKLEEELFQSSANLIKTEHKMISKINEKLPLLDIDKFFKLLDENYKNNNIDFLYDLMNKVQNKDRV